MALGKGIHDDLCTEVRRRAKAEGAIVIVINGADGSGFSCQGPLDVQHKLPDILEIMAKDIRESLALKPL